MNSQQISILANLKDVPNLVTIGNVILACLALFLLVSNQLELVAIALLWCVFLDYLDGHLARRYFLSKEICRAFGRELDSLADLIAFSVVPALFVYVIADRTIWSVPVALTFPVLGACRLAYFNLNGLTGGYFIGVPTTYVTFLFVVIIFIGLYQKLQVVSEIILGVSLILAILQVLPIRVPKLNLPVWMVLALVLMSTAIVSQDSIMGMAP